MPDKAWPTIRNRSDIVELQEIPWRERISASSVVELILANARKHPNKPAIKFLPTGNLEDEPVELTYSALATGIRKTANLLRSLGVDRTDVISLLVPPLPQSHLAIWAGSTAGIVSPVNFLMEAEAIGRIIDESRAKILIAYDDHDDFGIWSKVTAIRDSLSHVETVLRIRAYGDSVEPGDDVAIDFDHAMENQRGDALDFDAAINGSDTAFYIHTGGTTGTPKLSRTTHDNILFKSWATPAMQGLRSDETIFGAAPLYHVGGIEPTSAVPFGLGMTIVIPGTRGFRNKTVVENYWKYFARFGITRLYGVPTSYMTTVNVPVGDADLSTLRPRVAVGSAPLPAELARRYEALVGIRMANIYGLTEGTAAVAVAPPDGEIKNGSCGLSYPYVELRTVKKCGDRFVDTAPGESGEIVMRGPNVSPGYLKQEHNRDLHTPDGYLITGDVGRFDDDGYLWITGRSKDIIVRGGHNIDPQLTEEALYKHPAVKIAGAVAMPDPYSGELPVAFVELKEGHSATADELKTHARNAVSERAAAPAEVYLLEKLPLTAIGKVDKVKLRKEAALLHFRPKLADALPGRTIEIEVEDRHAGLMLILRASAPLSVTDSEAIARLFGDYSFRWELH